MLGRKMSMLGATLIELMISVTVGLIMISSVTALVVANMRNNTATAKSMRVTQESRALTEIITRELRRARYDGGAIGYIGSGVLTGPFNAIAPTTVAVASDCLKYSYDANGDGAASAGEFRMFSRAVVGGRGVVNYGQFDTAAAVTCTGGSQISSSDIDVQCLRFRLVSTTLTLGSGDGSACYSPAPATAVDLVIPAGSLYFSLRMGLNTDAFTTTSRRSEGVVMVRSPT